MALVVANNHFATNTYAEVTAIKTYASLQGSEATLRQHWLKGSEGTKQLASSVVEIVEGNSAKFAPIYPDSMPLFEKIETLVKQLYRAAEVIADQKI